MLSYSVCVCFEIEETTVRIELRDITQLVSKVF